LYFAFPGLYAASFNGFYLALMVVLWLLMLRGISIEFRNHIRNNLWLPFWDVVFSGAGAPDCFGGVLAGLRGGAGHQLYEFLCAAANCEELCGEAGHVGVSGVGDRWVSGHTAWPCFAA
jgi:cytochrome bd-type quinol oxidase subunit 2